MKKFMKTCAICALVFLLVGGVLALVAVKTRGGQMISETVEKVTNGHVSLGLPDWVWNDKISSKLQGKLDDWDTIPNYQIEKEMNLNKKYDIYSGDIGKMKIGDKVERIVITAGGCELHIEDSQDDCFYIEAQNAGKLQSFIEDNTFYTVVTTTSKEWNKLQGIIITVYVPESRYDSVVLDMGAGIMEFGEMYADSFEFNLGAGQIIGEYVEADSVNAHVGMGEIELLNVSCRRMNADVGMGSMETRADVTEYLDAKVSLGNLDLTLVGEEEDFNYHVNADMGNVDIGKKSMSGMGKNKDIDNNADKQVNVSCSMGNVSVFFTDKL